MKRILFAYPEVAPLHNNGGIGTFVFEAATLLAQSGRWEVDVLADSLYAEGNGERFSTAQQRFRKSGVTLHNLDRSGSRDGGWRFPTPGQAMCYDARVSALHDERRYDVIEFPDWKAPGFFSVRRKVNEGAFSDTRLVVHLHGSTLDVRSWHGGRPTQPDDVYAEFMEDYVKRHADAVVSPTEFLLEPVRRLGIEGRLVQRRAYPMQPAVNVRRRATSPLTIACCSRLELRKGQDILARAIGQLSATGALEGCHVVLRGRDGVGDARGGRMSRHLRRLLRGVEGWEIADAIDRDALARWLGEEVAICVVPSRVDNYPNVLLEAARSGCLVVCSDSGGIPELLADYEIPALVFPAGDVGALARQLESAIATVRAGTWSREDRGTSFEEARSRQAQRCLEHYEALASVPTRMPTGADSTDDGWPPAIDLTLRQRVRETIDQVRTRFLARS